MAKVSQNQAAFLCAMNRSTLQQRVRQFRRIGQLQLDARGRMDTEDLIRLELVTRETLEGRMEELPTPVTNRQLRASIDTLIRLIEPQAQLLQDLARQHATLAATVQDLMEH